MQPAHGVLVALLVTTAAFTGCLLPEVPGSLVLDESSGPIEPRPLEEWIDLLSKPRFTGLVHEALVIASHHGDADLAIDVYKPADHGEEVLATIVILSPYHALGYGKETGNLPWLVDHFVPRGYAVALADMRGTRNSSGCFDFGGEGDQQDGFAIVEHLAAQPWSNGRIGMYGVSHVGMSQLATAVAAPPHLTTIVPIAAISSFYRYLYNNGAHYDLNMATPPAYTAVATAPPTNPTHPSFVGNVADTGCDAVEHNVKGTSQDGRFDEHWLERDYPSKADGITASVFLVHGFVDHNVKFDHADAMWRALEEHDVPRKAFFAQFAHSEPRIEEWRAIVHRWMDHWLLDIDTGIMAEPAVTAEDSWGRWRNETAWPSPQATGSFTLHLAPGKAVPEKPAPAEATYEDVPGFTRGQLPEGTFLEHVSAPLADDLHVTGSPRVVLDAASSASGTKLAVLVYETPPGGVESLWNRGYLDTRQREDLSRSDPLTPGKPETFRFTLFPTDSILEKGTVLRIVVASTDGCGYVAQPVLFRCGPSGIVSDTTLAKNTVFYGGEEGTRIELDLLTWAWD